MSRTERGVGCLVDRRALAVIGLDGLTLQPCSRVVSWSPEGCVLGYSVPAAAARDFFTIA